MSDDDIGEIRRDMRDLRKDTKQILAEIGKVHDRVSENEKEVALVKQEIGHHVNSHGASKVVGTATTAVIVLVVGGLGTLLALGIRAWVNQ